MKNLLLLIFLGGASLVANAQKKLLQTIYHPQISKGSIDDFLQDLSLNSGVVLEYSSGSFEPGKTVQLEGNENTIGAVLQIVLNGQKVKLLEHNDKIILARSTETFNIDNFLPVRYSFFGYLREEASNEPLISATIYEPASQRGVVSNNLGYFNLLLPVGKHTVEISYGGLQTIILDLDIHGNLRKDVSLSVKKESQSGIVVESEVMEKDGAIKLNSDRSLLNGLMGDADPMQFTGFSMAAQNASASFGGLQVRGGGTDENLFLLDGNPVYNPTHMLGAISVISPTVLKGMRLYKSDFPAKFSGSLSSVLDVYTREGNMKSWHGESNIGLLAGSLTLEGPLAKDKTALMLSARKNISLPYYQTLQGGTRSDFYDLHLRMTTILNAKNKLAFNFYKGEDRLQLDGEDMNNTRRWGNMVGSIGWSYILGSRSFVHSSVNLSHYQDQGAFQYTLFKVDDDDGDDQKVETKYIHTYSSIQQCNARSHAEIFASKKIKFNIGVKLAQTIIKPFDSQISTRMEDDEKSFGSAELLHFEEFSAHAETEARLGKRLFIKPGVHATTYQFEEYHAVGFQPRLFASYRFATAHKISFSYGVMNQFLHLVTNPYPGAIKDIWVPSSKLLQPEKSVMYDAGYSYSFRSWKFSVDGYYKLLANVTNFVEGRSILIANNNWEQNVESGMGRSYGVEYMFEKNGTHFSWQAAYTRSWSWRRFNSINNGKEFPYKYDHRNTANFAASWAVSPHMNVSGSWTFATGNMYSLAGRVFIDSIQQTSSDYDPLEDYQFTYHYSDTSQYRAKPFQRYDLSIVYHSRKDRTLYSALKAGLYSISGSPDQYSYTLRGSLGSKSIFVKTGSTVLKMVPYVSWTLRF